MSFKSPGKWQSHRTNQMTTPTPPILPNNPSAAASRIDRTTGTSAETSKFNLNWISRSAWQASPPKRITPINDNSTTRTGDAVHVRGVPFVIIHHTAIPVACHNDDLCRKAIASMQRYHQKDQGWDDIGYNFLIGGGVANGTTADGEFVEIYEGRGFNVSGAHAKQYNGVSVGIALIGNWSDALPSPKMLAKLYELIAYGVEMGFIRRNYTLLGHRQVSATECPGARLFNELKKMPHFALQP